MVVTPKCPKCEHTKFGAMEQGVDGYVYNAIFICCLQCETVVGTLDYGNYLRPLEKISSDIEALKEEVAKLKG